MENEITFLRGIPLKLREVWKREDRGFTKWLEKNIDYLNEDLGIKLEILKREQNVGPFFVDLYAEEGEDKVVIENQLEKTDHGHLGKLLTYMINLGAKRAIWIAGDPVKEHAEVIDWLNQNAPEDMEFYLVKLEVFKMGERNEVFPKFSIVQGPSEEGHKIGKEKKKDAERHILRKEFWTQLLKKSQEKGFELFSNISPKKEVWISTGAGKTGVHYMYIIRKNDARCCLCLEGIKENNKKNFDILYKNKKEIEKMFGEKLIWKRQDDLKASVIFSEIKNKGGWRTPEKWSGLQEEMIERMKRMEFAFRKYIPKLK